MAGIKRITISDEKAVRALNLMAAMTGEEASAIATRAVLDLWEEKASDILNQIHEFSPLKKHLNGAKEEDSDDFTEEDQKIFGGEGNESQPPHG